MDKTTHACSFLCSIRDKYDQSVITRLSDLHVRVGHCLEDLRHVAREVAVVRRGRDVQLPAEVQLVGHLEEVAVLAATGRHGSGRCLVVGLREKE